MGWLWHWLRDEDFWKSITINVVSAGAVGTIAYLFAVGAGYLSRPELIPLNVAVPMGIVTASLGLARVIVAKRTLAYLDRDEEPPKRLILAARIMAPFGNILTVIMFALIIAVFARFLSLYYS